jgi:hypothetical protein
MFMGFYIPKNEKICPNELLENYSGDAPSSEQD